MLRRASADATWVFTQLSISLQTCWNHLWANIVFLEGPAVHIHSFKVVVVVVVSVIIVVIVVVVIDIVVYVHDGVDGNEDESEEGKGVEASLRRTTGRSRL